MLCLQKDIQITEIEISDVHITSIAVRSKKALISLHYLWEMDKILCLLTTTCSVSDPSHVQKIFFSQWQMMFKKNT